VTTVVVVTEAVSARTRWPRPRLELDGVDHVMPFAGLGARDAYRDRVIDVDGLGDADARIGIGHERAVRTIELEVHVTAIGPTIP